MKYFILTCISILLFLSIEVSAGITGKYNVSGVENFFGKNYQFNGTINVRNLKSGSFNLNYNDGDRASGNIKLRFIKPIKNNKERQSISCSWTGNGLRGKATAIFKRIANGYSVKIKYSVNGQPVNGRGSGQKTTTEQIKSQAVAWDISEHSDLFGKINMDLQNRFIISEIIDKSEEGVVRRNAGIHVINPESGNSCLLLVDELGVPTFLCIDDKFVFEFLAVDSEKMEVTWQLLDLDGNIVQEPTTTTAPEQFFGMMAAVAKKSSIRLASAENPPSVEKTMVALVMGGVDFATNAAELIESADPSMKKSSVFLAKSLVSATAFGNELATNQSSFISSSLWAYNTVECAMFLGAVAGSSAATLAPPVAAAGWLAVSARAFSGLSACQQSGIGVMNAINSITSLSPHEKAQNLIKKADEIYTENRLLEDFIEIRNDPDSLCIAGKIVKTMSRLQMIARVLPYIRKARDIIDSSEFNFTTAKMFEDFNKRILDRLEHQPQWYQSTIESKDAHLSRERMEIESFRRKVNEGSIHLEDELKCLEDSLVMYIEKYNVIESLIEPTIECVKNIKDSFALENK